MSCGFVCECDRSFTLSTAIYELFQTETKHRLVRAPIAPGRWRGRPDWSRCESSSSSLRRSLYVWERESLVRVRLQRQPPSATISAIVHTSHFSITSPSTSFASIRRPPPFDSHCQRQPSTPRIRRNCCCLFGRPVRHPDRSLAISQVYSADFMSLWRRRTALDRWTHDGRRRNLPV